MNIKKTPLLDSIESPDDLKKLSDADLKKIAEELRQETINSVSKTGGHLGAGLGVIELTVALHSIFDAPHDKIIWDVGHQSYPHKILTGRKGMMSTLRKVDGLSGFPRRQESEYDAFGTAHSSTSISRAAAILRTSGTHGPRISLTSTRISSLPILQASAVRSTSRSTGPRTCWVHWT